MDDMTPFIVVGSIFGFFFLIYFIKSMFIVNPNEAHVLVYWGRVNRTVDAPGFNFAFPIGLSRRVVSRLSR